MPVLREDLREKRRRGLGDGMGLRFRGGDLHAICCSEIVAPERDAERMVVRMGRLGLAEVADRT